MPTLVGRLALLLLSLAPWPVSAQSPTVPRQQPPRERPQLILGFGSVGSYAAVLVSSGTPVDTALGWLASVKAANQAEDARGLLQTAWSRGLLSYSLPTRRRDRIVRLATGPVRCEYWRSDEGRDVSIVVLGETPQAKATAWLDSLISSVDAHRVISLVGSNVGGGLRHAERVLPSAPPFRLEVSWGLLGEEPADEMLITMTSGWSDLRTRGAGKPEWLAAVAVATSGPELDALLMANRTAGMAGASIVIKGTPYAVDCTSR
jgi:hypothetical protein